MSSTESNITILPQKSLHRIFQIAIMNMIPDSRAFLDLDDEHADIDAKVSFVELSLHRKCDRMEVILEKINKAQRRGRRARQMNRHDVTSLMTHRVRMLQLVYNTSYQMSEHLSEQLVTLDRMQQTLSTRNSSWLTDDRVQ